MSKDTLTYEQQPFHCPYDLPFNAFAPIDWPCNPHGTPFLLRPPSSSPPWLALGFFFCCVGESSLMNSDKMDSDKVMFTAYDKAVQTSAEGYSMYMPVLFQVQITGPGISGNPMRSQIEAAPLSDGRQEILK